MKKWFKNLFNKREELSEIDQHIVKFAKCHYSEATVEEYFNLYAYKVGFNGDRNDFDRYLSKNKSVVLFNLRTLLSKVTTKETFDVCNMNFVMDLFNEYKKGDDDYFSHGIKTYLRYIAMTKLEDEDGNVLYTIPNDNLKKYKKIIDGHSVFKRQ